MEKIWKEVVVAELRYYLGIKLEGLMEAIGNFGQDTRCSAEIRNRYFPNISRALVTPPGSVSPNRRMVRVTRSNT